MDRLFPPKILNASIKDRLDYFDSKIINHYNLKNTYNDLQKLINQPKNNFILVYGCTGVGKSTLINKIYNDLIKEYHDAMINDPGIIPFIRMNVKSPHNSKFKWRNYYMQALKALEEPLLEKKICVRNTNPANRKANEEDLRRSLENALKYRNTKIILIDEAQHIGKVTNSKHLQSHMDCLKGLIDETNTKHILFGTFEMLTFRTNGQISRRARELHFKRYKYTSESDKNHFMEALLTFQKHLPIEKEPELLDYFEDIYASSVGCIGSVKNILYEALYLALIEGKSTITKETLEKAALSSAACNTIAREAIENEMIIDKNNDKQTLRKTLGMFDESPINNTAKKGKAVKRNPKRDIVGTDVV